VVGGAPLNVAAGLARLGATVEFVGSVSSDALGQRIWDLLARLGVATGACVRVDVPTALALTSLRGGVPEFTFYQPAPGHGPALDEPARVQPPSFAMLGSIDRDLVAGAAALYVGSIALMYSPAREAAELAWSIPGPLKVLDPNVRPKLLRDPVALRDTISRFASTADLLKLSAPDAELLFDLDPERAAQRLRSLGARAVVVTLGAEGAYADVDTGAFAVAAPVVTAVDTTGAGDACAAALIFGLMAHGWPRSPHAWRDLVGFATAAASLASEVPGGATAMPSLDTIRAMRCGEDG
jgi:fructokinase